MSGEEIKPGRAWPVVDLSEPKTDLAGVERRVSALERHLFDPAETEENADRDPDGPCETADPESDRELADYGRAVAAKRAHADSGTDYAEYAEPLPPLELVKGSVRGPGYIVGERADRAEALLGTVETIKTTGGAVEIAGVRIEPCDEYGRSATMKMLEDMIRQRDFAHRAIEDGQRETSSLLKKLDTARRQRDKAGTREEFLHAERERLMRVVIELGGDPDTTWETTEKPDPLVAVRCDAWIGGVGETAVRCHLSPEHTSPHEATLCGELVTWGNPTDGDDLEPTDEEVDGRGLIVCGVTTVSAGSWRECELEDGHAGAHYSRGRLEASW